MYLYLYSVEIGVRLLDFYTSFAPDHSIDEAINCRTQDFLFFYTSFSCHLSPAIKPTCIHSFIYLISNNFNVPYHLLCVVLCCVVLCCVVLCCVVLCCVVLCCVVLRCVVLCDA